MANPGKLALAMLGVLAYQNRDKLGDIVRRAAERDPNNPQGNIVDQLSKGISGSALGDILERLRSVGAGSKADSWVSNGPNEPIEPRDVEAAIDEDILISLSKQTGLSREELIARITRDLPEAVNDMTSNGESPVAERMQGADEPGRLDDVPPRTTPAEDNRSTTQPGKAKI